MSLLRTSPFEVSWPSWMRTRVPSWGDMYDGPGIDSTIRVEEFQEDGHYVIRAEVPGIDPDKDVDITVEDSIMRLSVHKHQQSQHEEKHHWRSEFSYGSFQRTILLPTGSTDENVKATYTDGVLEVRVPMNGKASKLKKIQVTRRSK